MPTLMRLTSVKGKRKGTIVIYRKSKSYQYFRHASPANVIIKKKTKQKQKNKTKKGTTPRDLDNDIKLCIQFVAMFIVHNIHVWLFLIFSVLTTEGRNHGTLETGETFNFLYRLKSINRSRFMNCHNHFAIY